MGVLYLLSKGSNAHKDGSRLVIEKEGNLVGRMPFRSLNSIVVGAAANISTAALFACMEGNIPVFFLDKKCHLTGQLVNEKASLTVIRRQFSCMEDKESSLALSKIVVAEKVKNQYRLLKSYAAQYKIHH